jgi:hypothetical protein
MILISHRGNLNGRQPYRENHPDYIDDAISERFNVEIDIWFIKNKWVLGHDGGQHDISLEWLTQRKDSLWIHAKNLDALSNLYETDLHYFWHQEDHATITSNGYLWIYPGYQPIANSIAVLPELYGEEVSSCLGICSDYISHYVK